jgi:hypothetical protein
LQGFTQGIFNYVAVSLPEISSERITVYSSNALATTGMPRFGETCTTGPKGNQEWSLKGYIGTFIPGLKRFDREQEPGDQAARRS